MAKYQHIDLHVDVVASLLWEQQRKKEPYELIEFKNFVTRNGAISQYRPNNGLHIVGRGNALQIGKVIADYFKLPSVCSDQDNFVCNYSIHNKNHPYITIVSASGSKGLVDIVKGISNRYYRDNVNMITSTPDNETSKKFSDIPQFVISAMPGEPYSYNFSTYAANLLRASGENVSDILKTLDKMKPLIVNKGIWQYGSYFFLFHPYLEPFNKIREIKMGEIFDGRLPNRSAKPDEFEHGHRITKSENELLICFGVKPQTGYDEDLLYLPIEDPDRNIGLMFSALYFVIGYIQKGKPPWFKESMPKAILKKRKDGWQDKTVQSNIGGELPQDLVKQAEDFVK